MNEVILSFLGLCSGLLVAGGVFTVLFVVGLVPRFACKTGTARYEIWYEECIITGTLLGCICSVFQVPNVFGVWLTQVSEILSKGFLMIIGGFAGVFVGCLALALAELLDSVPIFARRVKFKKNFKPVLWSIALGKLCGSLVYFWMRMG